MHPTFNPKAEGTMAKSANKKTGDAVATAANDSVTPAPRTSVTSDDVARRAYALYVARGRTDGHDVDDWLQAERELRGDPEC